MKRLSGRLALCLGGLLWASCLVGADTDWPRWRGPSDTGMATGDAPVKWTETENVKWKTEIPGKGHSSPVIYGNRIFLTTAVPTGKPPEAPPPSAQPPDPPPAQEGRGRGRPGGGGGPQAEHRFVLLALDRSTGKMLWERTAKVATPHEGYHQRYGSFASNSPVTDGKHVIAFFGSRGVYCYDMDGKLIWEKDFGVQMRMIMSFGEGAAPVLHENTLLLKFDHEGDSFFVALDKGTGKELWRHARDESSSWSAPLVITHEGRKQVIVSATNKVRSYDFKSGEIIWEAGGLGRNVIPNPVHIGDMVLVMSGFRDPNLMGIKLGRTGDLTGTDAIVWTNQKGNSYTPSPVLHDGKYYFLTDQGMISCFDAKTGKPYYQQQRLPKPYNFKASPVGAAGKLYLASENEDVIVLRMGEEFEVLSVNTMKDEFFVASPAIAGGEIFLRGKNTLYCIRGAN